MFSPTLRCSYASWRAVFLRCLHNGKGHPECSERPRNPFYDPYYEESVWGSRPQCYLGKKHLVTMAAGVGVGPEMMDIVKRVCLTANAPVVFEEIPMGPDADEKDMDNLIFSIERNGVAIKGNIEPKLGLEESLDPTDMSRNMQMRRSLDLFVNVTEVKSFPGLVAKTKLKKDVDVVLLRQNTEGEFAMLEHEIGPGVEHLKITTIYNTRRLAEFAFKYAAEHQRTKVTGVYNRDFLQHSEGLFLDTLDEVAVMYPDIEFTMQSMREITRSINSLSFHGDVLVTGALYGGIIASLLFAVMRGTGLYCGKNQGSRYAVFEPAARNKGYKMAGKDIANPMAALLCTIQMLRHLGHTEAAGRIDLAVRQTVDEDQVHTEDMLGTARCSEMVANIERRIRERMPEGYNRPFPTPTAQSPL